jgi:Protein of unknown function (DUF3237)
MLARAYGVREIGFHLLAASGLAGGARVSSWYVHEGFSCSTSRLPDLTDMFQPGGQDSQITVKELATSVSANFMIQTADENPAYIVVNTDGWLTGAKDVLEKLNDQAVADTINPSTYKHRFNLSMETGDERYAFVNTVMWVGSGCRRGHEREFVLIQKTDTEFTNGLLVIFDAFRLN